MFLIIGVYGMLIAVNRQSKDLWFESQSRKLDFSAFLIKMYGMQTELANWVLSGPPGM
jgi:hypothetical protein